MRTRQVIVTTVLVSLLAGTTRAARNEDPPRDAELVRSSVKNTDAPIVEEITFAGLRRISPGAVKMQIASRPGERFDDEQAARDVRKLAGLGWFASIELNVESTEPPTEASGVSHQRVRLEFDLQENPFLSDVQYSGSRLFSRGQIDKLLEDKKLAPKLGEPENPVNLYQIAGALKAALADLGHPEARVEIHRAETPRATVRVHFEIADGPHVVAGRVTFHGDPGVSVNLLQRQMREIHPNGLFGSLLQKNSYTRARFEEDRERLLAYYQNHGYPEARIGDARISKYEERSRRWIPWPRKTIGVRFDVEIPVEAGPLYRIESVKTTEAVAQRKTTRNKSLVALNESLLGHPYSARQIENLRRDWQARTQAKRGKRQRVLFRGRSRSHAEFRRSHGANRAGSSLTPPYIVRRLEFRGIQHFPGPIFPQPHSSERRSAVRRSRCWKQDWRAWREPVTSSRSRRKTFT